MALIIGYLLQIWNPLDKLARQYRLISRNFTNLELLFELLATPITVTDRDYALPLDLSKKGGEIVFKNVVFGFESRSEAQLNEPQSKLKSLSLKELTNYAIGYLFSSAQTEENKAEAEEHTVLHDVSFTIPVGTMTAIVGPSGSGKSTIAKLLCRYYDITKGEILIDGQNIKDVTLDSLRRAIGVVPQDTILFNESMKYNITYGAPDLDKLTDEELYSALEKAQLLPFIEKSATGLDTIVGERGLRISGGEKQRIAISRIIVKNPPILILDEATSALDTKTEKEIQQALFGISKGRTTLVVAHRLATIVQSDQIIVLKYGRVVEKGTHLELLALGKEYASMWYAQQEKKSETQDEDL